MRQILNSRPQIILKTIFLGAAAMMTACSGAKTNTSQSQTPQTSSLTVMHVDAHGAQALLSSNPKAVVLDIRAPKEIKTGHIEGAVFANFFEEDFEEQLTRLDKSTPYIVHCKGGGRSTKALSVLAELGFTDITHLDGGLDGWKKAKLPLTKP